MGGRGTMGRGNYGQGPAIPVTMGAGAEPGMTDGMGQDRAKNSFMETWKNTSLMEKRKQGVRGGNRHVEMNRRTLREPQTGAGMGCPQSTGALTNAPRGQLLHSLP